MKMGAGGEAAGAGGAGHAAGEADLLAAGNIGVFANIKAGEVAVNSGDAFGMDEHNIAITIGAAVFSTGNIARGGGVDWQAVGWRTVS